MPVKKPDGRPSSHQRICRREAGDREENAYRRLRIAKQAPVNLGEPLVLLHLRSATLAAQTRRFSLVEESRDDVLA